MGLFELLFGKKKERGPFNITDGVLVRYRETGVSEVVVPEGVRTIGGGAFYGCRIVKRVELPDTVERIITLAFNDSRSVREIIVREGVREIGAGAFNSCESLTQIELPQSLETLGEGAFAYCNTLTSVIIPPKITAIADRTFFNCSALTSVVLPDSVVSIGNSAFLFCKSLSEIVLPAGIRKLPWKCFYRCELLSKAVLPLGLREICESAFCGCYRLGEIIIPAGTVKIGSQAFSYCEAAERLVLPASVTDIAEDAFHGCRGLYELEVCGVYLKSSHAVATWQIIAVVKALHTCDLGVMAGSGLYPQLAVGLYLLTGDMRHYAAAAERFGEVYPIVIESKRYDYFERLLNAGGLVTEENIDEMIACAIERKAHEIFVMLTKHKDEHFGFAGGRFEL